MKILITGANGLLAQKLIGLLGQKNNLNVLATAKGNLRLPFLPKNTHFSELDITDKQTWENLIEGEKPQVVVNCAAITILDRCEQNPELASQTNAEALRHITETCTEKGIFLLHISTDFVFDGAEGMYAETDQPNPLSHYARTKYEAEKIVQTSNAKWAIVRTVLVYGVLVGASRSNLVEWVIRNLEQGNPIRVVDDQWRTPTLAEDLAEGCWQIISKQKTGIYHIAGKDYLTPYQFALKIAQKLRFNPKLISPTNAKEFKEIGTRPLRTGLQISKAQKELAYEPHSLDEGLTIFLEQRNNMRII